VTSTLARRSQEDPGFRPGGRLCATLCTVDDCWLLLQFSIRGSEALLASARSGKALLMISLGGEALLMTGSVDRTLHVFTVLRRLGC